MNKNLVLIIKTGLFLISSNAQTVSDSNKMLPRMFMLNVGSYHSIQISSNIKVTLFPAIKEKETRMIAVKGEKENTDQFSAVVVDKTLFLKSHSLTYGKPIKVSCFISNLKNIYLTERASITMHSSDWYRPLSVPNLNIVCQGASSVFLPNLDVNYLHVVGQGNCSILLAGFADHLVAKITSQINFDIDDLETNQTELLIPNAHITGVTFEKQLQSKN